MQVGAGRQGQVGRTGRRRQREGEGQRWAGRGEGRQGQMQRQGQVQGGQGGYRGQRGGGDTRTLVIRGSQQTVPVGRRPARRGRVVKIVNKMMMMR